MRRRPLGRSGLSVSEVGFGAWGIGGNQGGPSAYGPVDDAVSTAAIDAALDKGIAFFDTSDLYGGGHSEAVLGRALRGQRSDVVLATKAGYLGIEQRQDFSPAHLDKALAASLRRLDTDHLDLYQLHSPDLQGPHELDGAWAWMEAARASGKIRALGISARSPSEALVAIGHFRPDAIQVNFNFADQRARELGLFARAAEAGVGLILRTPLAFGFLAGDPMLQAPLAADDLRRRFDAAQQERWRAAAALFNAAFGENHPGTPAQRAIAYCLSFPGVATVIPGILTPAQADENAGAAALAPLSEEIVRALSLAYDQGSFYGSPAGS